MSYATNKEWIDANNDKIDDIIELVENLPEVPEASVVIYSSIAEMNQHTDLKEGTYALIINPNLEAVYKLINFNWLLVGDPIEALQAFSELADVVGDNSLEYEGLGGTEEEIVEILEDVVGEEGNE